MIKSILVLSLLAGFSQALTKLEYEKIRSILLNEIKNKAPTLIHPTLVRLSFHDCVSHCDGCINLNNPDNAGLAPAIDFLEKVYGIVKNEKIQISRADLWAIAGRVGAEWGMEGMPGNINFVKLRGLPPPPPPGGNPPPPGGNPPPPPFGNFTSPFAPFQYGRVDCPTAPSTSVIYTFPSPHMTHTEMFTFFEAMGLNEDQVVSLLGAHTLGKCTQTNSGYNGPWVAGKGIASFDNQYYKQMIDPTLTYAPVNVAGFSATGSTARPQYNCKTANGTSCGIMLNTDFELFYDMPLDSKQFLTTCNPNAKGLTCPQAATYAEALEYAEDNNVWITTYVEAYDVMTAFVDHSVVNLKTVV